MTDIKTLAYWYFILNFVITSIVILWLAIKFLPRFVRRINRRKSLRQIKFQFDPQALHERLNNLEDSRAVLDAQIENIFDQLTELHETQTLSKKSRRK